MAKGGSLHMYEGSASRSPEHFDLDSGNGIENFSNRMGLESIDIFGRDDRNVLGNLGNRLRVPGSRDDLELFSGIHLQSPNILAFLAPAHGAKAENDLQSGEKGYGEMKVILTHEVIYGSCNIRQL